MPKYPGLPYGDGRSVMATKAPTKQATSSGFDLGGEAIGAILGLLNSNGTYTPGTAATRVSQAGARAAAQAGYNQSEADRSNVYGQAVGAVKARNPNIQASYDKGTADLQANARARAIADRSAAAKRDTESNQAAARMGLPVAPPTDTRSDAVVEENVGQYQKNADSWQGFNTGAAQRQIERNNAVGDAFTWQGAQQQAALQQLLQQALGGLQDYTVGGSAGGWSGGLSDAKKLSGWNNLLNFSSTDFNNDLKAAKFQQSTLG
jgi:hypothetical protein